MSWNATCLIATRLIATLTDRYDLVVSSTPKYYDTIDSIYQDKGIMPHFLRGHYTLDWFRHHYEDVKLKEIYQRTMGCKICINDDTDYMHYVFNEVNWFGH